MDMLRVWPIVCEFGVGALLCLVGIWCGLRGGYLDLKVAEDRRLLITLVAGYFLLLAVICVFTFLAPNWANGGTA
ncbi:MAG TPA: hypothetical protein VMW24_29115 [Sedimentisphaerales bacterium]|jgi:hypothetical protein|nr:hypothetical protein [Sedimentisphaerales bacterium]